MNPWLAEQLWRLDQEELRRRLARAELLASAAAPRRNGGPAGWLVSLAVSAHRRLHELDASLGNAQAGARGV